MLSTGSPWDIAGLALGIIEYNKNTTEDSSMSYEKLRYKKIYQPSVSEVVMQALLSNPFGDHSRLMDAVKEYYAPKPTITETPMSTLPTRDELAMSASEQDLQHYSSTFVMNEGKWASVGRAQARYAYAYADAMIAARGDPVKNDPHKNSWKDFEGLVLEWMMKSRVDRCSGKKFFDSLEFQGITVGIRNDIP